jgi:hypothetical protein
MINRKIFGFCDVLSAKLEARGRGLRTRDTGYGTRDTGRIGKSREQGVRIQGPGARS